MTLIIRLTAFVVVLALTVSGAPRPSQAGSDATPTSKNCIFVRNKLPCPCPRAQQARAVARAAHVTVGAVGRAIGTTAAALTQTERKNGATQPAQPSKR